MSHRRTILRLGLPLLAGNLSMYLYRVVDSIMVGRLGIEALAGIAVGTLYAMMHEMLVWPVALGVQALVSRRMGRRMVLSGTPGTPGSIDTGAVLPQGLYAGLLAGSTALLLALAAPWVVPQLTPAASAATTLAYVRISMWSLPIMGVASALRGFNSGVRRTRVLMAAVLISNATNVILNWVFIFGRLGMPALGVRGAAVGTVLAHLVSAAILGGYTLLAPGVRPFRRTTERARPHGATIRRILAVGLPSAVQNALAMLFVLVFQGIVGSLGAMYVAVTHVQFNALRMNKALVGGFANGAAILVGNLLGAGNRHAATEAIRAAQSIAAIIGAVVFAAVLVGAPWIGRLYGLDGEALRLSAIGLRLFAPFFLIEVLGYSLEIIFSHNGWGRFVLFSEFTTNVVGIVAIPVIAVYLLHLGIAGAWAGFALYQVAHAAILGAGYWSMRWQAIEVEVNTIG